MKAGTEIRKHSKTDPQSLPSKQNENRRRDTKTYKELEGNVKAGTEVRNIVQQIHEAYRVSKMKIKDEIPKHIKS